MMPTGKYNRIKEELRRQQMKPETIAKRARLSLDTVQAVIEGKERDRQTRSKVAEELGLDYHNIWTE